jgi:hypothetical protein
MKLSCSLPLTRTPNKNNNLNGTRIDNTKCSRGILHRLIIVLILVFTVSFHSYGQKALPSSVLHDFAVNTYRNFNYGNGNLRAMLTYGLSKYGYGPFDVALGIEELEKDKKFRSLVFEVLYNSLHGNEELMQVNFLTMGMKASNAKILAKYMIDKYAVKDQADYTEKAPVAPAKSKMSKDTFIKKSSGPKYVYPGSNYNIK